MTPDRLRVADIRMCLARRPARQLPFGSAAAAAVTMLLDEGRDGAAILLIHRAERPGDPWSGHMAFPGGFRSPDETDLFHTAVRETREEVGIDIERAGECIAALDDVRASGGQPLDLIVRPYVCALTASVAPRPQRGEVQRAIWIPMAALRDGRSNATYRQRFAGHDVDFPAFVYQGFTIWGLTFRMLTNLLDCLSG